MRGGWVLVTKKVLNFLKWVKMVFCQMWRTFGLLEH